MKLTLLPRWATTLSLSMLICALAGEAPAGEQTASILKANGCDNCHAQAEQIVGPAFDAVQALCDDPIPRVARAAERAVRVLVTAGE